MRFPRWPQPTTTTIRLVPKPMAEEAWSASESERVCPVCFASVPVAHGEQHREWHKMLADLFVSATR